MQRVLRRFDGARIPNLARAAAGPVALAVYALSQYLGSSPYGLGAVLWAALFGLGLSAVLIVKHRVTTTQAMALEVLACSLITDWQFSSSDPLRDLALYLHAGSQFLAGAPVYTTVPLTVYPYGSYLPFMYAPPTVPVFAALSVPPFWLVGSLWVAISVAAVVWSLRAFGMSWRWAFLALLWTPIEQGLFVGNVVLPSLLLLSLAPRVGGILGLGVMFKPQNGILWLWLLRQRRWRTLVVSVAVLAGVVAITLPLTGPAMWGEWVRALINYQQSQQNLPGLYGSGLGRWLPIWIFVPMAIAVVLAALQTRGRKGLARLGLASVVASPSLWNHGFVFVIPEFLRLRGQWFWLAVGLTVGKWPGPQAALGLVVAGWFVGPLIHRATHGLMPQANTEPDLATHPLGRRAVQVHAPQRSEPASNSLPPRLGR